MGSNSTYWLSLHARVAAVLRCPAGGLLLPTGMRYAVSASGRLSLSGSLLVSSSMHLPKPWFTYINGSMLGVSARARAALGGGRTPPPACACSKAVLPGNSPPWALVDSPSCHPP